jgi:hypothetical protein
MLAARIGAERAALAFTSIMTAETCDQAEARLTLVLDYGNPVSSSPKAMARYRDLCIIAITARAQVTA